jgi:DNA-binding NarL/FixJ family response regulator
MERKIKIILVEDQELMRTALKALLKEYSQIDVVGEAANGRELLNMLKSKSADIVLLDIEMPVMNGKETLEKVNRRYPDIKVIMLSMHEELEFMQHFITSGAKAYIPKNTEEKIFIEIIHRVYEKGQYVSEEVLKAMMNNPTQKVPDAIDKYAISNRELEVLRELCNGKTENEIAEKLKISHHTAHSHRMHLYLKTNTRNIVELVKYALKNRLAD